MAGSTLVQLVASLDPADAVSDFARDLARIGRDLGRATRLVAARTHPACAGEGQLADRVDPRRAFGSDDVLFHHHSIGSGMVEWSGRFPGRAIVVHHSVTPPRYFAPWAPNLERAAALGVSELELLARVHREAVGVSEFDAREARLAGFAEVGVLPISPSRRRVEASPSKATLERLRAGGGPIVLTVGRLAPNKRVEVLLAAHALVTRVLPAARLLIVGGSAGMEGYALALKELARELRAPGIEFTGVVDDGDLTAHYLAASVFALASEHEGRGLPLIEAMHHGVPVVARSATAIPETVGGAARLLDGEDPATWARALVEILKEAPARIELIERGRERARRLIGHDLRADLKALLAGELPAGTPQ